MTIDEEEQLKREELGVLLSRQLSIQTRVTHTSVVFVEVFGKLKLQTSKTGLVVKIVNTGSTGLVLEYKLNQIPICVLTVQASESVLCFFYFLLLLMNNPVGRRKVICIALDMHLY